MTTITKVSREYRDVDFSFAKHAISGGIGMKSGVSSVKQSILHLLQLRSGDKPFHPEIRSPIYEYLFENVSSIVKIIIEDEIIKYLNAYEPRASISEVTVTFTGPNAIACSIRGTIINLQEPFTVEVLVSRLR